MQSRSSRVPKGTLGAAGAARLVRAEAGGRDRPDRRGGRRRRVPLAQVWPVRAARTARATARRRALRRAARPPVAFASLQNCMLQRRCEQLVYKNRECPHCSQLYCVGCINYDEPCLSCGNRFDESRHNKCVPGYACEYACEYPSEYLVSPLRSPHHRSDGSPHGNFVPFVWRACGRQRKPRLRAAPRRAAMHDERTPLYSEGDWGGVRTTGPRGMP